MLLVVKFWSVKRMCYLLSKKKYFLSLETLLTGNFWSPCLVINQITIFHLKATINSENCYWAQEYGRTLSDSMLSQNTPVCSIKCKLVRYLYTPMYVSLIFRTTRPKCFIIHTISKGRISVRSHHIKINITLFLSILLQF